MDMVVNNTRLYYFRLVRAFGYREWLAFKKDFRSSGINSFIWPICISLVFGKVLPAAGIIREYGSFMGVGICSAMWIYNNFNLTHRLLADIEGNRFVQYELMMPLTARFLVMKYGICYGLRAFGISLPLLFVTKLVLGNKFSFVNFNPFLYYLVGLLSAVGLSFFMLTICALTRSKNYIDVRVRVIDPLFLFGGYLASWSMLSQALPGIAPFMLLNPITHVMEASRASVLGQPGYVPIGFSLVYLICMVVVTSITAYQLLKRRLDFV